MKTLLQINVEVNYGSTGRIAEEIGKLALKQGWASYIAYGRKKRQSASKLIAIGHKWDQLYHLLLTRLLDRHGLASKMATKKLIRQIIKLNPSIIHLHNLHGYYLNLELLFSYLNSTNIPLIWTFHDCWAMTGHCTHFENVNCEKWKTTCHQCPQLGVYPSSWGRDRSKKNHQLKKRLFHSLKNLTIVPVSHWMNTVVQKSFLSGYSSKVVLNGIDIDVFSPRPCINILKKNKLENQFIILGVASVWSENKGFKDFIKLSRLLGDAEKIVLIGLNKKQISGLPKNIIGLERTSSIDELAQWYSAAHVYVNTSLEESFGLTTAEAMACGTPSIVYNTTACPEMISPEVGLVSETKNITVLYSNILQIKDKGKGFYKNPCRERAIRLYNKNDTFQEYISLYDQLTHPK